MKISSGWKWLLIVCLSLFIVACAVNSRLCADVSKSLKVSDHYRDGKFYNASMLEPSGFGKSMRIMMRFITQKTVDNVPIKSLPVEKITREKLEALSDDELHIVKLGHSSVLLKAYGEYWLIDPMFSERASPFSFIGPKRFHPTPISIDELPPISRVLISHNHYDHLDKPSIEKLAAKTKQFFVPIGVDSYLRDWGVEPNKITALDWWQELQTPTSLFVFTPAKHFSGRSVNDRDKTLWGSWVINTNERKLYFSGDSGYFSGFKEIGEKYGPFDLTMIETGAYSTTWPDYHMQPEESVQAHIDLQGVTMLPIHNSTFDLAFHPWYEPLERVSAIAQKRQISISTPIVGEIFTLKQAPIKKAWWRDYQ